MPSIAILKQDPDPVVHIFVGGTTEWIPCTVCPQTLAAPLEHTDPLIGRSIIIDTPGATFSAHLTKYVLRVVGADGAEWIPILASSDPVATSHATPISLMGEVKPVAGQGEWHGLAALPTLRLIMKHMLANPEKYALARALKEGIQCPITLDTVTADNAAVCQPCCHVFTRAGLTQWQRENKKCPLCRQTFTAWTPPARLLCPLDRPS